VTYFLKQSVRSSLVTQESARPLRWWSRRQLVALETLLDGARQKWLSAWIDDYRPGAFSLPAISSRMAHDVPQGIDSTVDWQALYAPETSGVDSAVWLVADGASAPLAQLLFKPLQATVTGVSASKLTSLSVQLASQAWSDCAHEIQRVLAVFPGDKTEDTDFVASRKSVIPSAHHRLWSGAVNVTFPLSDMFSLQLHIGPNRAAALMAASDREMAPPAVSDPVREATAVVPLSEAIAGQMTQLRVELTTLDISVGSLQALATGDVLLLSHALTQPLQVSTAQGEVLCGAYLGQAQGQRAIELIKPPVPAHA